MKTATGSLPNFLDCRIRDGNPVIIYFVFHHDQRATGNLNHDHNPACVCVITSYSIHYTKLYDKFDLSAVKHLFSVAAGLDSMIIGEDQIIGQIKDAYVYCTDAGLTDAILMRLFQKSFEAGKRARTETGIKLGNLSVSSTAVEMVAHELGDLKSYNFV